MSEFVGDALRNEYAGLFEDLRNRIADLRANFGYFQTMISTGLIDNINQIKDGPVASEEWGEELKRRKYLASWHYLLIARLAMFEAVVIHFAQFVDTNWDKIGNSISRQMNQSISSPVRQKAFVWLKGIVTHQNEEGSTISADRAACISGLFIQDPIEIIYKAKACRDAVLHRAGLPKQEYSKLFDGFEEFIMSNSEQKEFHCQLNDATCSLIGEVQGRLSPHALPS